MAYGIRLLEQLLRGGTRVWLIYSQVAQIVARQEMDLKLPAQPREAQRHFSGAFGAADGQLEVFGREDWFAPVASGSNPADAMAICPCSMGTLASIAAGLADTLIERAADVMLKESRRLVLVPRETPFSAIHLENMLRLQRAGAVILPANPGFYHRPRSVEEVVDFVVARVLDQLGVPNDLVRRWGDEPPEA
jgi:4-hydroxy-3-polyprenylbenzoate decarboxylase